MHAQARTPLVGMIDVDLSFNARFSQSLLTNTQRVEDLVRDARLGSLLIPPAFEAPLCERPGCSDGRAAGQVAVYSGKPQLQALLRRGWLDTFRERFCAPFGERACSGVRAQQAQR